MFAPSSRRGFLIGVSTVLVALRPAWASGGGAHGGGGEEGEKVPEGPQFVKVGPINVPVLRDGRVAQYLMLVVALEAKDADAAKQLENRMPQIKDAYLSSLFGALHISAGSGELVDVAMIRSKVEAANTRILPAGLVNNVFLQQVEQRPR